MPYPYDLCTYIDLSMYLYLAVCAALRASFGWGLASIQWAAQMGYSLPRRLDTATTSQRKIRGAPFKGGVLDRGEA
jgi:hypothetical protein